MTDAEQARTPDLIRQALEKELARLTRRALTVTLDARLREDLGLDSLHLIEVAVWCHECYGVNLGERAAVTGRSFHTVRDLVTELTSP